MKRVITLALLYFSIINVAAQNLETQGGLDSKSISKTMRDGVSSSRVIILSDLSLSYTTNMGDIPAEDIGSGLSNGMNADTLYFYLDPYDNHRRLIITAYGFAPTRIDLKLSPKATYLYTILEPANASDEFLQREKQYELGCQQYDSKSWVSAINTLAPLAAYGHFDAEDKLCEIFWDYRNRESLPSEIYSIFTQEAEQGKPYAQFIICTQYFDKYGLLTTNEDELFKRLESAALGGSSYAQSAVASAYQAGAGVELDYFKAVEWYERASTLENPCALMNLAIMVSGGLGVKADKNRALELVNRSASQGQEFAMETMGTFYAFGKGFEKSSEKAIYWYEKAGNAGCDRAWGMIGMMYLNGTLVQQDYKKAFEYFSKGVELEDSFSMALLGTMYITGAGFKEDRTRGLNWYTKSANLGDSYGQSLLAALYQSERNYKEAWKWYKISGDNRNYIGYDSMGQMCEDKQAPSPNKQQDCIKWYEKAASSGGLDAMKRLIEIYSKGIYVKKSRENEIKWRVALANAWYDIDAMLVVANAYLNGDGIEMNELEAIKYLERAASLDSKEAMLTLAKMYREGIGVFVDEEIANEWEQKAR